MITISFTIFALYVAIIIVTFGIPTSLSDSFYLLEAKKKGIGYLFTGMMWIMGFLLLIPLLDNTPEYWQFLAFLPVVGILAVGTAPAFKQSLEGKVHYASAALATVLIASWLFVCFPKLWPVLMISVILMTILMFASKSTKCFIFWAEMAMFLTAYVSLYIIVL